MTSQSITGKYHTYTTHFSAHYLQKMVKVDFHCFLTMLKRIVPGFKIKKSSFCPTCKGLQPFCVVQMEIDYVTVDLLFRVMPIGDGARLIPLLQDIRYGQRFTSSMARNGKMDAAGLKMLRWLSVTGNGRPPCSWNKMLVDLKRLRSSQGVCDSISTCCHSLYIQKQTPSWLKAHCVGDVTTASLFPYNERTTVWQTVQVLLRESSRRIYKMNREKASELG